MCVCVRVYVCVCIPVRTCVCMCVHVCSYVCVPCMSLRNKQFTVHVCNQLVVRVREQCVCVGGGVTVHVCNQLHCPARLQHYQQPKGASILPFILLLR